LTVLLDYIHIARQNFQSDTHETRELYGGIEWHGHLSSSPSTMQVMNPIVVYYTGSTARCPLMAILANGQLDNCKNEVMVIIDSA
jgi:hypothetical protein